MISIGLNNSQSNYNCTFQYLGQTWDWNNCHAFYSSHGNIIIQAVQRGLDQNKWLIRCTSLMSRYKGIEYKSIRSPYIQHMSTYSKILKKLCPMFFVDAAWWAHTLKVAFSYLMSCTSCIRDINLSYTSPQVDRNIPSWGSCRTKGAFW